MAFKTGTHRKESIGFTTITSNTHSEIHGHLRKDVMLSACVKEINLLARFYHEKDKGSSKDEKVPRIELSFLHLRHSSNLLCEKCHVYQLLPPRFLASPAPLQNSS